MKGQGQKLGLCFLAGDVAVAAASWVGAYGLRFATPFGPPPPDGVPPFEWCLSGLPLIMLLAAVSCRIAELYSLHRLRRFSHELWGVVQANALLFLLLIAVTFYRRDPYKSRLALGMFLALNGVGMIAMRRAAWWLVHSLRHRGLNPSRALIVGSGRVAQKVARALETNGWTGLEPLGFVDDPPGHPSLGLLGPIAGLAEIIEREQVAYVFVALPLERSGDVVRVMQQLADLPVDVRLVPDVPQLAAMSLSTSELDGLPIVSLRTRPHDGLNRLIKRGMDVAIALLGLLVLSPLLAVIAVAVKLTSRGPVFYRQERASLGGAPFPMLKFRTMRVDAEQQTGPVWTIERDPRCTWLGRWLRRTSLDELPQLVNVLRGEMSLVGPRPERPVFVDKFRGSVPHYMLRHSVKAGITGWAQVHGWRGNTSLRKRVQYDLDYIAHWTPWLDIRIMLLTLLRGMIGRNAY
jgi:Undecaprenyl-phosphate glucose phosphotransferase